MKQKKKVPTSHENVIKASWQRCENFGLEHGSKPSVNRFRESGHNALSDEYIDLVKTTDNEVLPYYENILSNTQCLILLTDNQGQALNSWGDKRFLSSQHKAFFDKGVDWREQSNGTNAIGTALACGEAVQVQRDEHFLKANRFMVGSASPIYDVNRTMLGILDISSDAYLPQAHTLGMVKLMSQAIENRLIVSTFGRKNFLLVFNTNVDNLDSQWSGLIVFNEEGTIISANRRAEYLLCYDLAMVNITDIFNCPLRELKSHPEQLPLTFIALGKFRMHGTIKRPTECVIKAVDFRKTAAKKTDPDSIPLKQLSFGDEKIARCIYQAERIIDKDIPILIHGETGVGKEVFVKALHHHSLRRNQSLVAVNCAAIPGELVESELFGYIKGAFTGASNKGAVGLIRKAHKGTLFLDEIGEMPLKVQARLLRVLQERKVTPLGSTDSYSIDIKLISATNRSLKKDVESGLFRRDLYYRVSGLNLEIPPLRERTDRKLLFNKIHQLYCSPQSSDQLSEEILHLFYRHPWPGNIRQLVSVIQIAHAMADDGPIQTSHLPDDFFNDIDQPSRALNTSDDVAVSPTPASPLIHTGIDNRFIAQPSNEVLLQAYSEYKGNISKTSRELGLSRNTLYKRLRGLGIR